MFNLASSPYAGHALRYACEVQSMPDPMMYHLLPCYCKRYCTCIEQISVRNVGKIQRAADLTCATHGLTVIGRTYMR